MGFGRRFVITSTQYFLEHFGPGIGSLCKTLTLFTCGLWVYVSTVLVVLFNFFSRVFHRIHEGNGSGTESASHSTNVLRDKESIDLLSVENDTVEDEESKSEGHEKDSSKLIFKFPTFEEFLRSNSGNGDGPSISEMGENDLSSSFETPNIMNEKEILNSLFSLSYDFEQENFIQESLNEDVLGHSAKKACKEEGSDNPMTSIEQSSIVDQEGREGGQEKEDKEKLKGGEEVEVLGDAEKTIKLEKKYEFLSEKEISNTDSNSDSPTSSHEFSLVTGFVESFSDGFLSDRDFETASEVNDIVDAVTVMNETEEDLELEELQRSGNWNNPDNFDEEDSDIIEELRELEESGTLDDNNCENKNSNKEKFAGKDNDSLDVADNSVQRDTHNLSSCDPEDPNGLETLWEHQDFIEQLKTDIRKCRSITLPTIEEEAEEQPEILEDLKPWKIDDKFEHEDRMDEPHKLYKSYRERMRKFDILNYQKMYAIGFMRKKDPQKSISTCKSSPSPAIACLLLDNLKLCRPKKPQTDPSGKFIRELQDDLEAVYVGQLCLSWEILRWQYGKALELYEADSCGLRRYDKVAGEFQQFQVLIQRFLENESFEEGSRFQTYIKKRCVTRNLLEVPLVREDGLRDIKKAIREGKNGNAVTSDKLVEVMEESIRTFWKFLQCDKDASNAISSRKARVEPSDLKILTEVQASLQKKERKLKDFMRGGHCIMRKFQKNQDDNSDQDQVLCFFSQVDMQLVRRVLSMSKLTAEQLLWCCSKLNMISFMRGKIHVEPSFLLFPC